MTKFQISVLDLEDDEPIYREVLGDRDLEGLRGFLRATLEISDEKLHLIERELQSYQPLRVFDDEGSFSNSDAAFEIVPFDE